VTETQLMVCLADELSHTMNLHSYLHMNDSAP